jgi:AcrR family transcriptional regulator
MRFMRDQNGRGALARRLASMANERARRRPRKKPAQKRAKETVRAVIEAAARILVREGYERTNVNHVAKLAGVSVGSIYQYFPSKEALVAEVARDLAERTLAHFQDGVMELALLPLREAVRGVMERAVRALRTDPQLREVILQQLPADVFDTRQPDSMLWVLLREYFQFHSEAIRPMNIDLAVAILQASVDAVAKVTSIRGDPEEDVVAELTHLVYGYIARDSR